jgi:hypothetical protein
MILQEAPREQLPQADSTRSFQKCKNLSIKYEFRMANLLISSLIGKLNQNRSKKFHFFERFLLSLMRNG